MQAMCKIRVSVMVLKLTSYKTPPSICHLLACRDRCEAPGLSRSDRWLVPSLFALTHPLVLSVVSVLCKQQGTTCELVHQLIIRHQLTGELHSSPSSASLHLIQQVHVPQSGRCTHETCRFWPVVHSEFGWASFRVSAAALAKNLWRYVRAWSKLASSAGLLLLNAWEEAKQSQVTHWISFFNLFSHQTSVYRRLFPTRMAGVYHRGHWVRGRNTPSSGLPSVPEYTNYSLIHSYLSHILDLPIDWLVICLLDCRKHRQNTKRPRAQKRYQNLYAIRLSSAPPHRATHRTRSYWINCVYSVIFCLMPFQH